MDEAEVSGLGVLTELRVLGSFGAFRAFGVWAWGLEGFAVETSTPAVFPPPSSQAFRTGSCKYKTSARTLQTLHNSTYTPNPEL